MRCWCCRWGGFTLLCHSSSLQSVFFWLMKFKYWVLIKILKRWLKQQCPWLTVKVSMFGRLSCVHLCAVDTHCWGRDVLCIPLEHTESVLFAHCCDQGAAAVASWLLILFHRHTWIYCLLYYSLNCKNHFSCRFLCNTFPPLEKHKCLPRVFMSYSVVWLTQTWLDLENDSCFRAALRLWTSPLLEALDNANVANVIMVLWLTVCGVTVACVWLVSLFVIENVCFLRM